MTPGPLLGAAVLAGFGLERLLLWWRPTGWFAVAMPLGLEPLPLAGPPQGSGETATVSWEMRDGTALFWIDRPDRGLVGLHGSVRFVRDGARVRLLATWAPPWSLLLFAGALAGWGAWLGVAVAATVVASAVVGGTLIAYRSAAVRAVVQLRWAWHEAELD